MSSNMMTTKMPQDWHKKPLSEQADFMVKLLLSDPSTLILPKKYSKAMQFLWYCLAPANLALSGAVLPLAVGFMYGLRKRNLYGIKGNVGFVLGEVAFAHDRHDIDSFIRMLLRESGNDKDALLLKVETELSKDQDTAVFAVYENPFQASRRPLLQR